MRSTPRAALGGALLTTGLALASAVPADAQLHGLFGSYYRYFGDPAYLEDFTFSDPDYEFGFSRIDNDITFGWEEEHTDANNDVSGGRGFDWEPFGPDAGAFGVHWEGFITIPDGDPLYLGTQSDDGSFVFVNDGLYLDNGGQHFPTFGWGSNALTMGTYKIDVFLFGNDLTPPTQKSGIDLWWSPEREVTKESAWVPGESLEPVPEPATLVLLTTGLLGGTLARRRRRRSTSPEA